jgi:hypothetical protein
MKKWRYDILLDLYEGSPELAVIIATEPRDPLLPPELHWKNHHYPIPYSRFDALISGGDLVELSRRQVNRLTCVLYGISLQGQAVLESLPNFAKRAPRQITIKA